MDALEPSREKAKDKGDARLAVVRVEPCEMDTIERRFTHERRARVLSRPSTTTPASWSSPDNLFPASSARRNLGFALSNVNPRGRRIGACSLFGRVADAPSSTGDGSSDGGVGAATAVEGRDGSSRELARSKSDLANGVDGRRDSGWPRARPAEDTPTTVAEAHSWITGTSQPLKGAAGRGSQKAKTRRHGLLLQQTAL